MLASPAATCYNERQPRGKNQMSAPVLTAKTPAPPHAPSSFVSERHANPLLGAARAKKENFTWAGILAIVTTILFLVLIAMQWMDWEALKVV
jgi:hypothetical protein